MLWGQSGGDKLGWGWAVRRPQEGVHGALGGEPSAAAAHARGLEAGAPWDGSPTEQPFHPGPFLSPNVPWPPGGDSFPPGPREGAGEPQGTVKPCAARALTRWRASPQSHASTQHQHPTPAPNTSTQHQHLMPVPNTSTQHQHPTLAHNTSRAAAPAPLMSILLLRDPRACGALRSREPHLHTCPSAARP